MRRILPTLILSATVGLALLWHAEESGAQAILATGPDAEVTEDGLHRVDPSIMGAAWVRPDLDLAPYDRIYFVPAAVQFRDVPNRRLNVRSMETVESFFVNESSRTRLRELFGEAFYEAVGEVESFELSDEVGRDVLLVQGLLTDVISGVPPDVAGSVSNIGIRWVWEANIVLELRDSMSDAVLARTADRERIDGPFGAGAEVAVTPSVVQSWSQLLVGHLEEVSDLSGE